MSALSLPSEKEVFETSSFKSSASDRDAQLRHRKVHDPESGSVPHHDELELERINTSRLQQQQTVGSTRSAPPPEEWLPMGAGKPYPPSLPHWDDYVVEFEGSDDPMHPHNWPMKKRYVRWL